MKNLALLLLPLMFTSCMVTTEEPQPIEDPASKLVFPDNFDFKTSRAIELRVDAQGAIVRIYSLQDQPVFIGSMRANGNSVMLEVPTHLKNIKVVVDDGSEASEHVLDIQHQARFDLEIGELRASAAGRNAQSTCTDRLFAVENSRRGLWSINLENDRYLETRLPDLEGGGSIACALDQDNGWLYYNVKQTMYKYDIASSEFSIAHQGNPFKGNYPRLAFRDNFFYMSNGTKLYKVGATTNEVAETYKIEGIVNSTSGGDLAFTREGTLYMSCFSGLYRFVSFEAEIATVVRVSAENFPYQLTSMAIDRQDRIFVGTNEANAKLLEMNANDGSFRIVATYDHKINDLTAWRCEIEDLGQNDSDGDGVIDVLDDHPNDAEAAFDIYTPSEIGFGTIAFEDLWPGTGDFDFNDLVVKNRFVAVLNSNNMAVRMEIKLQIAAAGATYRNGFGIELPIPKAYIQSVTGTSLKTNMISVDDRGLEQGHETAVIIAFDDALAELNGGSIVNTVVEHGFVTPRELNIIVEFTQPIEASYFENPPFNPFMFINGDRGREVHLINHSPTALADLALFSTADDYSDLSAGTTYQNADHVPWAISIIHNFRYPREKVRVDRGYHRFVNWGHSKGVQYADWYKDNTGYRDDQKLYFAPE